MHLKGGIDAFTLHLQLHKYYKIVFKKITFFSIKWKDFKNLKIL